MRVGIVAPGLALRAGLRALLGASPAPFAGSVEPNGELQVVYEAATLNDEFPADADVLLITAEALAEGELRRLASIRPGQLGLLLLGDNPQPAQGVSTLPLRGWGLVSVDAGGDELIAALRAVHEGLWVGSPALLRPLLPRLLSAEMDEIEPAEALTERESQVLQYLARGLANKQIAMALGISEHTVKFHVSAIYAKLGATNRTEAVRRGVQSGLIVL